MGTKPIPKPNSNNRVSGKKGFSAVLSALRGEKTPCSPQRAQRAQSFFKVKTPKLTDDIIAGVGDGHKAHSKTKT